MPAAKQANASPADQAPVSALLARAQAPAGVQAAVLDEKQAEAAQADAAALAVGVHAAVPTAQAQATAPAQVNATAAAEAKATQATESAAADLQMKAAAQAEPDEATAETQNSLVGLLRQQVQSMEQLLKGQQLANQQLQQLEDQ
jgi:hypothetical protein